MKKLVTNPDLIIIGLTVLLITSILTSFIDLNNLETTKLNLNIKSQADPPCGYRTSLTY